MSQIWRDNTEKTISSLSETSARAAEATRQSLDMQDTLLENQVATLDYQKQIAANGSALSQALESSRANARALMEEFRTSTDEQRALIFSIFDRVSQLQSLVVSEVSWFYTVIFYAGCLLLVYITTATKRTADARIPLIVLLTLNFVVERVICTACLYGMEDESNLNGDGNESSWTIHLFDGSRLNLTDLPQIISARIWYARKLTCVLAAALLTYFAYTFKDYNVMNNKLLHDIQRQNIELRKSLDTLQIIQQQNSFISQSSYSKLSNSHQTLSDHDVTDNIATPQSQEDTEISDSDDSTLSFNSTRTDQTWKVGVDENLNADTSDESCDDYDSFYGDDIIDDNSDLNRTFTLEDNYESDVRNSQINNLDSSYVENVSSTTSTKRTMDRYSRSPSVTRSTRSSVSCTSNTTQRRLNRRSCTPTISGRGLPCLVENVESSNSRLNKTCYNLRDRSKIISSRERWDACENPVLDSESPNAFGNLVAEMAKIAKKNSQNVRAALKKEMDIQKASGAVNDGSKTTPTLCVLSDDE